MTEQRKEWLWHIAHVAARLVAPPLLGAVIGVLATFGVLDPDQAARLADALN